MGKIIGIDLGTITRAAVMIGGKPTIIQQRKAPL